MPSLGHPVSVRHTPTTLLPTTAEVAKKTLVLDLDQTLVFSSFKPLLTYDFKFQFHTPDNNACAVYVVKRPGVDGFLIAMAAEFELVVFTAGTKSYADPLLNLLDPEAKIAHRLYRDSCVQDGGGFIKDLSSLGRDLEKVIIVDDDPKAYKRQTRNAIRVSSFSSDKKDRELPDLIPILLSLADSDNVIEALKKHKEKFVPLAGNGRMKSSQCDRFLLLLGVKLNKNERTRHSHSLLVRDVASSSIQKLRSRNL